MDEDLKRCSKCKNEKELSEFNVRTDTQKYRKQCRGCIKLIKKESRKNRRKTDFNFRFFVIQDVEFIML